MTLPVLKEILRGIEGLWIRSFDDIVCIHTVKNKNGVVYYIYLNGGVEVEVECAQDQERECSVNFVGRRLIVENLDIFEDIFEEFLVRE